MLREAVTDKTICLDLNYARNIRKSEAKRILNKDELYRSKNWYKLDGEYYYIKYNDTFNEVIGECIAHKLDLATATYMLAKRDNTYAFATPNFKEKGAEYYYLNDLVEKLGIEPSILLDKGSFRDIERELVKLYTLDIFMRQFDRCSCNIMFKEDNSGISLAPVYDYACSLQDCDMDEYQNDIETLELNSSSFDKFVLEHPELRDYLDYLLRSVDLREIVSSVANRYSLNLKDEDYEFYRINDEISKKLVRRLLWKK